MPTVAPQALLDPSRPWKRGVALDGCDCHGLPMKALAGRRILIAEDESLIALELEGVLQDLGCEVVGPVTRVDAVLGCIEAGHLHGALLDVNLRGQQIFGLLPKVIELGVPVIITSGYNDVTLFPEPFRAVPRIAKPFDFAALRRLCVEVFAEKS